MEKAAIHIGGVQSRTAAKTRATEQGCLLVILISSCSWLCLLWWQACVCAYSSIGDGEMPLTWSACVVSGSSKKTQIGKQKK